MKNFKITIHNRTYYVKFIEKIKKNGSKRICCMIKNDGEDFRPTIDVICYDEPIFTGTAKCHPDDAYSIEEGCAIAFQKAMTKRNSYWKKKLSKIEREINKMVNYSQDQLCLKAIKNKVNKYIFKLQK